MAARILSIEIAGPAYCEILGELCASRRDDDGGFDIGFFFGDFCGLTSWAHLNGGCLRIADGESS